MNNKDSIISLYHISDRILEKPIVSGSEQTNDYGRGFYCTTDEEIIQYKNPNSKVINKYNTDISNLAILDLTELDIIYWITLITNYRSINVNSKYLNRLKQNYMIDLNKYDCVSGWRCDGTISTIINNFFQENITSDAIYEAIKIGLIQPEFVLKSQYAFDNTKFICSKTVDKISIQKLDVENTILKCQESTEMGST